MSTLFNILSGDHTMDTRTELEQIHADDFQDVIAGRGFLVDFDAAHLLAIFVRTQKIYSENGTSTTRVWDVVDYSQNENGRHVMTCGTRKEAKRIFEV